MPIEVAQLPRLDAIVISHDHYDHLDLPTVRQLLGSQTAPFLVPIGIGAHLRGWGVPEDRIVELDWDEQATVGELTLTCTESRHFSGRGLRRNTTLWCSWAITGPAHRVYFGGDTGYTGAFTGIGERYGPFDVTVLPIGAYGEQWPDIHLNPEEAVQAHLDLGGDLFVPIHWATFDLALHTWAEPVERLLAAGQDLRIAVPRPGERIAGAQSPDARRVVARSSMRPPELPCSGSPRRLRDRNVRPRSQLSGRAPSARTARPALSRGASMDEAGSMRR